MPDRFFVDLPIKGTEITVSGDSAHHILNVMRMQIGSELVLFDGSNREFHCTIVETAKKSLTAHVERIENVSRELNHELTVAVALPKGDRQKVLVEKLVEIGITRLIPINSDRSVVIASDKSTLKLKRRVIEASKQSGRNRLMEIATPLKFNQLLTYDFGDSRRFVAHPYANSNSTESNELMSNSTPIIVAIGPEGGFSDGEVTLAIESGWSPIQLGQTIMRVETAAVVAGTILGIALDADL